MIIIPEKPKLIRSANQSKQYIVNGFESDFSFSMIAKFLSQCLKRQFFCV
jgi:hypothetical protein